MINLWKRFAMALALIASSVAWQPAMYAAPINETNRTDVDVLRPEEAADPAISPAVPEGLQEINDAQAALAAGDLDACRNKLRAAFAKSPNLPPPKLMLARMQLSQGQIAAGRQLLEEVAVSHPKHPDVYLLFGKLALADGHPTDAAVHFEKALALEVPKNWNDGQKEYLRQACLKGKTAVAERRGDWLTATELYQEQIDAQPKNAELRDRFAMVLFHAGDLDRAFEQFDLAHLQDASMNEPEISMAVMHVRKAEFEKSDEWFAKAFEKHARDAAVYFEHSIAMLYQDRTEEAAASAAKAAELGMSSPLLTMHRGLIAMQQGDRAAAEKYFGQLLQESPENVGAMTKLALLLSEQTDDASRAKAVELAEAAGKLRPNSPEVVAVLGWAYCRTGKQELGEQMLRAAAAQPHTDPLPLFLFARQELRQEKTEEGQKAAELLNQQIDQPGLFVLRPAARKWLKSVLKNER